MQEGMKLKMAASQHKEWSKNNSKKSYSKEAVKRALGGK